MKFFLIKPMRIAALLALVLAAPLAASQDGWKRTGGQGVFNFVLIDRTRAADMDTFRIAAASVCGMKPICQVGFWTDAKSIPSRLPMSDAQANGEVAHWAQNLNTGHRKWLWNCKVAKNMPEGDCM